MKRVTIVLAATAALVMSPSAQAASTISSVSTEASPDGSFTTTFSVANLTAGAGGLFTETLDFTTLAGLLGIRVDTSANVAGGVNDTDILQVLLTGGSLSGPVSVFPTPFSTDTDEVYRLRNFPVDPGLYTLTITGTPALQNSALSGQLLFTANATSAVPEPATWVMLMAGMGVIGFAMRRSRASEEGLRRVSFNMA